MVGSRNGWGDDGVGGRRGRFGGGEGYMLFPETVLFLENEEEGVTVIMEGM